MLRIGIVENPKYCPPKCNFCGKFVKFDTKHSMGGDFICKECENIGYSLGCFKIKDGWVCA